MYLLPDCMVHTYGPDRNPGVGLDLVALDRVGDAATGCLYVPRARPFSPPFSPPFSLPWWGSRRTIHGAAAART